MKNNNQHLLVLNNGSSSLKFTVYEYNDKNLGKVIINGSYSGYNTGAVLVYRDQGKQFRKNYTVKYSLKSAWQTVSVILANQKITTVGIRVVHGGPVFKDSCILDKDTIRKISRYNHLAPLHNVQSLEQARLVQKTWPRVKIIASFDTAWYAGLEPEAYLYSLPVKYCEKFNIRKYGFHGLSHEMACAYAAQKIGISVKKLSAVSLHLGSGCSISWLEKGVVKDTTMGFSPNEGLTMATRTGDLPVAVAMYLFKELKMSWDEIDELINKKSGLIGLYGNADLREVLTAAGYKIAGYRPAAKYSAMRKKLAKQALAVYVYDIRRYLASYLGMSVKPQAIVFTGVVGMNSAIIRNLVIKNMRLPKGCRVLVAPEGEMINIAQKTWKFMTGQ
jgi:acetate kinase